MSNEMEPNQLGATGKFVSKFLESFSNNLKKPKLMTDYSVLGLYIVEINYANKTRIVFHF